LLVRNRSAVAGDADLGLQVRNCEALRSARPGDPHYLDLQLLSLTCAPAGRIRIDNSVVAGQKSLSVNFFKVPQNASIRMTGNVVLGDVGLNFILHKIPGAAERGDSAAQPVQVELSSNLLDVVGRQGPVVFYLNPDTLQPEEGHSLLQRLFHWRQDQDVFSVWKRMVACIRTLQTPSRELVQFNRFEEWQQFWQPSEINVLEGTFRYRGGDLRARLVTPDQLTPDDFRLRADSAGYRAGPDGKDLGPDIDLVGPGPAYERWKKTPEYQQWLKDTEQRKESGDRTQGTGDASAAKSDS
jgi:hypothetical protein